MTKQRTERGRDSSVCMSIACIAAERVCFVFVFLFCACSFKSALHALCGRHHRGYPSPTLCGHRIPGPGKDELGQHYTYWTASIYKRLRSQFRLSFPSSTFTGHFARLRTTYVASALMQCFAIYCSMMMNFPTSRTSRRWTALGTTFCHWISLSINFDHLKPITERSVTKTEQSCVVSLVKKFYLLLLLLSGLHGSPQATGRNFQRYSTSRSTLSLAIIVHRTHFTLYGHRSHSA